MRQYSSGYSLAESLVTLFIVAVITTLSLANYRSGQNSALLRQTTAEMVNALRDAQQHALSATCQSPWCPPRPFSYGVHFDEVLRAYEVFADMNDNGLYDGALTDTLLVNPSSERPGNIGLVIELQGPGNCNPASSEAHITFLPPLPQTNIRRNPGTDACTKACLFTSLSGQTWLISVDQVSGLIESSLGVTTC